MLKVVIQCLQTQIDQSNILFATQTANQLADAVVNLAANQLRMSADSVETFPLADLLALEPFAGPFKNLKKDSATKFDATDSALATLKGIKALTEVCAEDSVFQEKLVHFGMLCLLRRFLLHDDYEKLAATEAYDASRGQEGQNSVSNASGESSALDTNNSSSVRVPPTAHIRKHAARLLTVLSLLPRVQKAIVADKTWCKWLDDCANGKIHGCRDLKIQSYARATLLNVFCNYQNGRDPANDKDSNTGTASRSTACPRYNDMLFLINPELPHWNCPENKDGNSAHSERSSQDDADSVNCVRTPENSEANNHNLSSNVSKKGLQPQVPSFDIVFVHGLRGGPYKTWRISEDKSSTKSGLVEKIDQEAGKLGTFWPGEWLSTDFPHARLFTLKYKVCFKYYLSY